MDLPEKLKAYEDLGFDPSIARIAVRDVVGTCPFCSKPNKFMISLDTGMFSCKSGACGEGGNIHTFLRKWYTDIAINPSDEVWTRLSMDRGIPAEVLKSAGLRYYASVWYIPITNKEGNIINFRRYRYGGKLIGLSGIDSYIYNIASMYEEPDENVYICEGEWDTIALKEILRREGVDGVVVGVPGAAMFKDTWCAPFNDKNVILCYDNDDDGRKGVKRVHKKIAGIVRSFSHVVWPSTVPDKFDMRDFLKTGAEYNDLRGMIDRFSDDSEAKKDVEKTEIDTRPDLSSGTRSSFENDLLPVFKEYLYMPEGLVWALRLTLAVILSVQIEGDPVWLHIASVPGSGKTEIIRAAAEASAVHYESSLTPHTLVSGWGSKDGEDPSLLPLLNGKCLTIKDFTTILKMHPGARDEILSVLRDAFDGYFHKKFGNGIVRDYVSHFHIVTGVTQEIYANSTTSMGERFLIYHQIKGVGYDAEPEIRAALENTGEDDAHREALREITKKFLDYRIQKSDIPKLTDDWITRIVGLSQFVAMLRAQVTTAYGTDRLTHRPQHEMGTRLAKQFKKLLLGLALVNWPIGITEDDYRLLVRVAADTCIGFNLEIVTALFTQDGMTSDEIAFATNIPISSVRDALRDMELLGIVKHDPVHGGSPGRPQFTWWVTEAIERHWAMAKLGRPILEKDVQEAAARVTLTTRMMTIKRAGSAENRTVQVDE